MTKNGLTIDELMEAVRSLPEAPKLSELSFVENPQLPDNTIMVNHKLMAILKEIFSNSPQLVHLAYTRSGIILCIQPLFVKSV